MLACKNTALSAVEACSEAKLLQKLGLPTADAYKEVLQLVTDLPKLRVRVELRVLDADDGHVSEEGEADPQQPKDSCLP